VSFLRSSLSKNIATLKSRSRVNQGHRKWYHSIDRVWFLLVFYSNFVHKTHAFLKYSTSNMLWPSKTGLGFVKVIENVTVRYKRILLTFHSNHGPISYRVIRRFQSKIAKFSHPFYFASPLKGFPLELDTGAGRQKLECCNGADEEIFTIFSRLDRMHERNS